MAFFDKLSETAKKLGEQATEVAKNLGDKASDAIGITKLETKILGEKNNITNFKKELGEIAWEKFVSGELVGDFFTEKCEQIKASLDNIANFEAEIQKLKDTGAEIKEEVTETVAETVEEVKETVEEVKEIVTEVKACPLCNVEVPQDTDVCPVCGYKF